MARARDLRSVQPLTCCQSPASGARSSQGQFCVTSSVQALLAPPPEAPTSILFLIFSVHGKNDSPLKGLIRIFVQKFLGIILEFSRTFPGHLQGISRKLSGNVPDKFRELSGKCPGNFREMSGIVPGNVREMSRKFPGNIRETSGTCPGNVQECFGKFPRNFKKIRIFSGKKIGESQAGEKGEQGWKIGKKPKNGL